MSTKAKIKQSFSAASLTYDNVAGLQRKVGSRLLERIGKLEQNSTMLDLGCGTGFLCEELIKHDQLNAYVLALDLAYSMLKQAMTKLNANKSISYICADAENLPLQTQSVDLVISNLALQWCADLPGLFAEIRRVLKPGGQFCFTTFGMNTLYELKRAWQTVDDYQHVNNFYSQDSVAECINRTGFECIEITANTDVVWYKSVWDLMAELKQLGAQTVLHARKNSLTGKSGMQRMVDAYQKFGQGGIIPATFETITVIARLNK